MALKRVFPVLLLDKESLIKSVNFCNPVYVGDPINAVRIFNQKEVDELVVLGIYAWKDGIYFDLLQQIAEECFMPLSYGGGICSLDDVLKLNKIGIEKFVIGAKSYDYSFLSQLVKVVGSQSIICAIDVKHYDNYELYINNGNTKKNISLEDHLHHLNSVGIGEILLTSIDREGTWEGLDLELFKKVSKFTNVPVILHGGAGSLKDIETALRAGVDAVGVGSMSVFQAKGFGVLINFPNTKKLEFFRRL